jgi:hypothetical protein
MGQQTSPPASFISVIAWYGQIASLHLVSRIGFEFRVAFWKVEHSEERVAAILGIVEQSSLRKTDHARSLKAVKFRMVVMK